MGRGLRRVLWASSALVLFACYTYRVDESQVKTIASSDLDCDPRYLRLEVYSGSKDHVASYSVHGCGRHRDYECTEDPNGRVECKTWHPAGSPDSNDDGRTSGEVAGAAVAAGACACDKLLSGSHNGGGGSQPASTSNAMPSDPVRSQ